MKNFSIMPATQLNNGFISIGVLAHTPKQLSFDPITGWLSETFEEKNIFFIKGKAEHQSLLLDAANKMLKTLQDGSMSLYREFSRVPFYTGDKMDVNPSTGEAMGRYSKISYGTPAEASAKHRKFTDSPVIATNQSVASAINKMESAPF